ALRRHMLAHPLRTGTAAELRWVMAETEALRQFRVETPSEIREVTVAQTRHWVMRDLHPTGHDQPSTARARDYVRRIVARSGRPQLDQWDNAEWESVTLQLLWMICREGVGHAAPPEISQAEV